MTEDVTHQIELVCVGDTMCWPCLEPGCHAQAFQNQSGHSPLPRFTIILIKASHHDQLTVSVFHSYLQWNLVSSHPHKGLYYINVIKLDQKHFAHCGLSCTKCRGVDWQFPLEGTLIFSFTQHYSILNIVAISTNIGELQIADHWAAWSCC